MPSLKRYLPLIAGATLAVAGGVSFAVDTGRAAPRAAVTTEDAYNAAIVSQVALATFQQDRAGLHDLEEATAKGEIPRGALGNVRRARIVVAATQWPEPLQAKAAEFVHHALELEATLRQENAAAAAPHAKELHDVGHDLSNLAYTWLGQVTAPANAPTTPSSGHGDHAHN